MGAVRPLPAAMVGALGAWLCVTAPAGARTEYRIAASLDPATHAVEGVEEITWTNGSSATVADLPLYLHLNAFSGADTLFMRETQGSLRGAEFRGPGRIEAGRVEVDGVDRSEDCEPSETWLRVPLDPPVPPGGAVVVRVEFTAHLPPVFARAGWAGTFHMAAQWFPKAPVLAPDGSWQLRERHANAEFFSDHADYDVTVTVPPGFVVGATGREVAPAAGERGHRFAASRVVDFAFVAWDGFAELNEVSSGVALRWLYPPEAGRTLERQRVATAAALALFSSWFGDPPGDAITVVLPPAGAEGAGGMEYPGLVTTASSSAFPGYRDDQEVAVHELAHQWFYALVAGDETAEPWIDEGLATFATGLALDETFGDDRSLVSAGPLGVGYFPLQRAAWRAVDPGLPATLAADRYPTFDSYGASVYSHAALAFHAMSEAVGRNTVIRGLRRYVDAHRFGLATGADLLHAMTLEAGTRAVDRVLRPALDSPRGVDLRVSHVEIRLAASDAELIAPRQGPGPRYLNRFTVERAGAAVEVPVEIEVRFPGTVHRARWDGTGAGMRLTIQSDRPMEAVAIDPNRRVLLDEDLLDNGWRASSPPFASGLGDEIVAAAAALLAWMGP